MSWYTRVINEWKSAGIIERIAWAFTILYPIFLAVKDMGGYMPTYNFYPIFEIALYIILIVVILLNIKTRKERDVAKGERINSEHALRNAQIESNRKIEEIQNNAFERIQKAEQEVVLARADGLEAIEVTKDGNKQIIREIEHNCEKKNAQLVDDCQYLLDQNQQLKSNTLDGPGSTFSQWSDFANAAPIRQDNLDDARITAIRNRLQKQIK